MADVKLSFGSPGYGDALSAVGAINKNPPSIFANPLIGEEKTKLVEQAMVLAKNWHEAKDPKSKERMEHVMMQLKVSGSNGDEKFNLLSRMMKASYGVDIGSTNFLASAINDSLNKKPQTMQG